MPRYYFDFTDHGKRVSDTDGTVFADIEAARTEALCTLGGIAKDELANGDQRLFVVEIHDGDGRAQITASLSLNVERFP
jgi:hypothetical protein